MKSLLLVLTVSLTSVAALADQCAAVSGRSAARAISILNRTNAIYQYCQDCGDTVAVRVPVRTVGAEVYGLELFAEGAVVRVGQLNAAMFYAEISATLILNVNGRSVDLAYVYDSAGRNLGAMAGCQNSSPYILPSYVR